MKYCYICSKPYTWNKFNNCCSEQCEKEYKLEIKNENKRIQRRKKLENNSMFGC